VFFTVQVVSGTEYWNPCGTFGGAFVRSFGQFLVLLLLLGVGGVKQREFTIEVYLGDVRGDFVFTFFTVFTVFIVFTVYLVQLDTEIRFNEGFLVDVTVVVDIVT